MTTKNVMLAPNEAIDFHSNLIKYPVFSSAKMDGMRCLIYDGKMYSRALKPLSKAIHQRFDMLCDMSSMGWVFDGELYSENTQFSQLMSMLRGDRPSTPLCVRFHVFDMLEKKEWDNGTEVPFEIRVKRYHHMHAAGVVRGVAFVDQKRCASAEELQVHYEECLQGKMEGTIVRACYSGYKHGRATLKEGTIFKFKKFETFDAQIVGYEQGMTMSAEYRSSDRGRDEAGRLNRTSSQDTRVPIEKIGSYILKLKDGRTVGAGLARGVLEEFERIGFVWVNREKFLNKWCEARYMPHGTKDVPRFAAITRLRPDLE